MALSDAYATAVDYIHRIKPDADGSDDDYLDEDLLAVSRYLDGKLGRNFNRTDEEQSRVYVVKQNDTKVSIDDMADVPSLVEIDQDRDGVYEITLTGPGLDYEMLPRNAQYMADPLPYDTLALLWWSHRSLLNESRMKITGYYGWPACPMALKLGTIYMTSILRLESPRATQRIPEAMDAVIQTSPDGQRILRDLMASYTKSWTLTG